VMNKHERINHQAEPDNFPQDTVQMPALLTKAEVADLLGVTVRTVNNLMARRKIPFVRLSHRIVKIPADALRDAFKSELYRTHAQLAR
jgi:excisionase family DNA binding protein